MGEVSGQIAPGESQVGAGAKPRMVGWGGWGLAVTCVLGGAWYGVCVLLAFPSEAWGAGGVGGLGWVLGALAMAGPTWVAARVAERGRGLKRAGLLVALGTLPMWGGTHTFLWETIGPLVFAAVVYFASYAAVYVWVMGRWLRGRRASVGGGLAVAVGGATLWTALEYLRGEWVLGGYSFFNVGQAPIDSALARLVASLVGAYGVTWLVALVGVAVGLVCARGGGARRAGMSAAVLGVVAVVWGGGEWAARQWWTGEGDGATLRVGVVQTSAWQSNARSAPIAERVESMRRWSVLTREAAAWPSAAGGGRADVVVWPETMVPGIYPGDAINDGAMAVFRPLGLGMRVKVGGVEEVVSLTRFGDELRALQREVGVPLVVGAVAAEGVEAKLDERGRLDPKTGVRFGARFNSVMMVEGGRVLGEERGAGGGRVGRHDKIGLMPFGEYLPLVWRWPGVQRMLVGLGAAGMSFDLAFGETPGRFVLWAGNGKGGAEEEVVAAAPICSELFISRVCRRVVVGDAGQQAARVMLSPSNDGWFYGERRGREMFLLIARWRCAELGVPMVRSVNTGISAAIDGRGEVTARGVGANSGAEWNVEGVLHAEVVVAGEWPGGGVATLFARTGEVWPWAMLIGAGLVVIAAVGRRVGAGGASGAGAE
jgi:apolipoprotein N-acyltransferase